MKKDDVKKAMKLYLVTDRRWLQEETLAQVVEESIKGGVTCVQIREKNLQIQEFIDLTLSLKTVCQKYQIPLIVNDNLEVMLASNADGIHVGQSDMSAKEVREKIGKDKILGVSVQNLQQALIAQENGADYLGVGAVFYTGTKDDAVDVDYETLKDICTHTDIPVVAIGGISEDNILKLKGSYIDGVAVVSAIMAKNNIKEAAKNLKKKSGEL